TQQPTSPEQQSIPSYSDEEVRSFAVAVLAVEEIKAMYGAKLMAARSRAEQQKLHEAASRDMVKAVKEQGISVDKYKEMLVNAQANPVLAEKVNQNIKEHLKEPGNQEQVPGNGEPGDQGRPDDSKQ